MHNAQIADFPLEMKLDRAARYDDRKASAAQRTPSTTALPGQLGVFHVWARPIWPQLITGVRSAGGSNREQVSQAESVTGPVTNLVAATAASIAALAALTQLHAALSSCLVVSCLHRDIAAHQP